METVMLGMNGRTVDFKLEWTRGRKTRGGLTVVSAREHLIEWGGISF